MEYERFAINLGPDILFVIPQGDETYIIMKGDDRLGVIELECINGEMTWISEDLIAPEYVRAIGEAIEEHEV